MKNLKLSDLRKKKVEELEAMVAAEHAALFKARRDLVFRQTTDVASVKTRRHNIARMHTVATELKRAQANNG